MNLENPELLSEREKMLAGELYLASDPELVAARLRARRLLGAFNRSVPGEPSARRDILEQLFGKIGPQIEIEPPFYCDYGTNIEAGDRLFMNFGCVALDCARITLGENVLCGPHVQLYTAGHPVDPAVRSAGPEFARPIVIGSDVWLGGGVIVCPGVTIGSGSTIGAGAVVTRDVPPRVVAAGNPCRVLRSID